jgi:hypothetical protein
VRETETLICLGVWSGRPLCWAVRCDGDAMRSCEVGYGKRTVSKPIWVVVVVNVWVEGEFVWSLYEPPTLAPI